ncbi:MAG TPA: hypothetical protein VF192_03735 [Longimicrobiales bacterium]
MTGPGSAAPARAWLARREPRAPEGLLARMDAALAGRAEPEIPEAFAGAAFSCLRAALAGGADRSAAWDLLAADALLTYACEAAAEQGPDGLAALRRVVSPERFMQLLAGTE